MKNFFKSCSQKFAAVQFMLLAIAITNSCDIYAQEKQSITGQLIDKANSLPVPYATVKLSGATDHEFIGGSISDPDGVFTIGSVAAGKYILCISSIGYKPVSLNMEVGNGEPADAGMIELMDTTLVLDELVIVSERIKAKSEQDKTIFFVTKKMLDVSSSGTDLLRLIPGVQVDLRQNISLEGSSDILIFVDGKERDKRYLSQLSPAQIDQIEVLSAPPANYDGDATGAINIILKKGQDSGFSGHLLAEVPVLYSEIYVFPSYSLNYTHKKLNLYTSYNGEITYLDLHENTRREFRDENGTNEISIEQNMRQKDWSHKFHFGVDYFLSERDQLNFYSFYNPYSRELDGKAFYQISGVVNNSSEASKEDSDMNTGSFYSLYYKHSFNKKGSELTADLSNYILKAENRSDFIYGEPENSVSTTTNVVKPKQNAVNIKIDYKTLLGQRLGFGAGVKAKLQVSKDRNSEFEYTDNIFALYSTIGYKQEKFDLGIGLRIEESVTELKDAFNNPFRSLLPDLSFRYKINTQQNIQLSASRSIKRPNLYQMNPYIAYDDPFTISMGNPLLNPELTSSIYIEHSIQFDGSYFASRVFYNSTNDVISNLILLNDDKTFVKRYKTWVQ
ncbi:MAG: TonB-dependent receptor [Bacteroidales bacterium]|nr:TonB-dependent receptor [Bacteroidales bacterium]